VITGAAWVPRAARAGGVPPESLLHPAGPQAQVVFDALNFSIWAAVVSFVLAAAVAAYAVWGRRRRAAPGTLPPQVEGHRGIEVAWTVVLVVGALVMLVHPIPAEFAYDRVPDPGSALTVKVTGHQWWWEFQYPRQGIVTANELHIPAGRVVRLEMTSADVIHAFAVPRLGGHDWAMPGRITTIWIQADRPGLYQGQCTELCGASHANMLTRVIVQSPGEFEAWVRAMQHPVVRAASPLAQEGERLFTAGPCQACHTMGGTSARGRIGPNLTLLGDRTSLGGGVLPNTPETLAAWIRDPSRIKPGARMPALGLTDAQIAALVAFLEGAK
jgi:cytochrome c oxidase subunit 2